MVDVKKVPNVRRSIRFEDDSEYSSLEITEMPDRRSVRLTLSEPDQQSGAENSIRIELTADQWKVLQGLDYIDEDQLDLRPVREVVPAVSR